MNLILKSRILFVKGDILKLEFLHSCPDNEETLILLVITVQYVLAPPFKEVQSSISIYTSASRLLRSGSFLLMAPNLSYICHPSLHETWPNFGVIV